MRNRFVECAAALLNENPRTAVVLAEIGVGQFQELGVHNAHPDRFINVGIREQLLIGVASGMAKEGFIPIVHSYTPFLVERPFEQIKLDFVHQDLTGILVSIGASADASSEGRTHHAPEDVALISTLPGWSVSVPGHADEVELPLRKAVASPESTYLRLSSEANGNPLELSESGWSVVRRGSKAAPVIVAVGPILDTVQEAVDGTDATILYTAVPHPVDAELLRSATTGTELITVEPYLVGTMMPHITRALSNKSRRYLSLGFPIQERRHYGTPAQHFAAVGLDASGVRASIAEFIY